MPRVSTVPATWVCTLLERACDLGLTPETIVGEFGREFQGDSSIDLAKLRDPQARVPMGLDLLIWRQMIRQADSGFGLHFAEQKISDTSYGVVGYLAKASDTVGNALRRSIRYHRLVKGYGHTRFLESEWGGAVVKEFGAPLDRAVAMATEMFLASYVTLARRWTGLPIAPTSVQFQHQPLAPRAEYERFFAAPVYFGTKQNEIFFDRCTLDIPLIGAEPMLVGYLEQVAEKAFSELGGPESMEEELRELIAAHMSVGDLHIDRVARMMGMSSRTLQRRLQQRDLAYQDVVDEVRRERAVSLIGDEGLSIQELGDRLGFAESRSFRRAFKRWTGESPSAYRRRYRGQPQRRHHGIGLHDGRGDNLADGFGDTLDNRDETGLIAHASRVAELAGLYN